MFEFKKKVGLLITMYDEFNTFYNTLINVQDNCKYIGIVQSGENKVEEIESLLKSGNKNFSYSVLPNLGQDFSRWELPARAICRNYSHLFKEYKKLEFEGNENDVEYLVCITGDTLLWNLWGIETILDKMEEVESDLGCARAMNQSFHSSDIELSHFESGGVGGGRLQNSSNDDFMPQMFIVKNSLAHAFSDIQVTNKWCSEQCLGDAMNKENAVPFVFSWEAYGFADGVVYNYKSSAV